AAEEELERVAGQAGLDLDFLRSVSPDTLIMLISPTGEPEPGRCWITAELFLVDGLNSEDVGDVEGALDRYERARLLYELLGPGIIARGFPEVSERLDEVRARIANLTGGATNAIGPASPP
ncbi:MAG TPA: hypothetical protein VGA70_10950, partial [Longimicrobiales bacterium]